jgi:hypothetical protein
LPLPELTAENAYIFRITHNNNLPWILDNGLHCRNSHKQDPNFVNIGLVELIDKRKSWPVPVPPKGTLSDYVSFYFTPRSMMAYNIHTGRNVQQRDSDFTRDNDDPDKTNRYMAEALVHKHVPTDAILYVACCGEEQRTWANDLVSKRKLMRVCLMPFGSKAQKRTLSPPT